MVTASPNFVSTAENKVERIKSNYVMDHRILLGRCWLDIKEAL